MSSLPPRSFGLPLIGETLQFILDPQFVEKRYRKYGSVFKTRVLGKPAVFMVGSEAVEFLLSTGFENFSWRDGYPETFQKLLGRSLFVQEGEEHRRNRRLIMPAFHGAALARYFETMNKLINKYLLKWEQKRDFKWFEEFKQLTFEIASQIFLGIDSSDEAKRFSDLFATLTDGFFSFPSLPGSRFHKSAKARDEILAHLDRVIDQRREHPTDDALSLLIQAEDENGDRLTSEEIRVQALLLLFAGHETTTAMLTWLVLELARHPEVLELARSEQKEFDRTITLDQLTKMPYLDQVLNEVERLHPPVAGGFRGVIKPFEFAGYHVPQGWMAQYSILFTHRLPELYPNPEEFNVDRWKDTKQKPFSLIGFGGGSRICIGLAFAKLEMKLIAAHLLRNYAWDLLPNQSLEPVIIPTRRPKDGLKVRFQRVD
ncbi:MAG: cytochrome P450 [Phormidium tanganyikae FI6-MK23]|jgi:cytochrome P450|nr:cytochrome P450 [Phormidium tanganyikae FI6-MK23]